MLGPVLAIGCLKCGRVEATGIKPGMLTQALPSIMHFELSHFLDYFGAFFAALAIFNPLLPHTFTAGAPEKIQQNS